VAAFSDISISVIIPTLNAEKIIGEIIDALKGQSVCPKEFIIIDSGSRDHTLEIIKSKGIEPISIKKEEFHHGRTRNLGASLARGEVLVFMTQDALPYDRYLIENLLRPLRNAYAVASFARQLPREDASPIERFLRGFNYPPERVLKHEGLVQRLGIKTYFFSNVCSAVLTNAFKEVGGFPENVPLNEDMLLAYRLLKRGYKVSYEPDARVYHSHKLSPYQQFLRYYRIGQSLGITGVYKEIHYSSEGIRYLREGMRYLIKEGEFLYIIPFIFDVIIRYTGFQLGLKRGRNSDSASEHEG
jgi:rhamnosyltransferase